MDIRRNPEPGRQAVLWLATVSVVLMGVAGGILIIAAAVEKPSELIPLLCGVLILLGLWLAWALTPRNNYNGSRWLQLWVASRNRADKSVLRIGRKRRSSRVEFGTNPPPTLDSVREAAEQNVSWVPRGTPPSRPRPTAE
ncbi:MAG: hypothetical protein JSS49_11790 [Planctomycetes bacterium]|nr:hypothetical protein [Planctomycetota bacterium]